MAWPPPVLPINRTDSTVQQGTHPADHNAVNLAVNDTVTKLTAVDASIRRTGAVRGASNQVMNSGVTTTIVWSVTAEDSGGFVTNSTDTAVPAGMGGLYAVCLKISVTPAPSAACIASLIIAANPWVGPPLQASDHLITVAAISLAAGQVIQARFYNGGGTINSAANLSVYRIAS